MSCHQKNENTKQKWYSNKFNKDFKNDPHQKSYNKNPSGVILEAGEPRQATEGSRRQDNGPGSDHQSLTTQEQQTGLPEAGQVMRKGEAPSTQPQEPEGRQGEW